MLNLSVVILNWNGLALLKRFLPILIKYTPTLDAEIVVADNASTDDSIAYIQAYYPSIRIIQLDKNYGFAEGYNQAFKQVNAKYLVLLNSDVEVTEGWLEAPLAALDKDEPLAAIQPKILSERNKQLFEYAGACGGFIDKLGYPFCRGRILNTIEEDQGQYNDPIEIFWASGACLIIRQAVYREVGGLDSFFFAHQEEIDLCWRILSRGYHIQCIPQSVVYHVGGATLAAESPRKTFLNFRNNLLMLYKNLPSEELCFVLMIRFWLDYIAAIKFLLDGKWLNAEAIYQARTDFKKKKKDYLAIRTANLANAIDHEYKQRYNGSILFAYYFKGIKTMRGLFPNLKE